LSGSLSIASSDSLSQATDTDILSRLLRTANPRGAMRLARGAGLTIAAISSGENPFRTCASLRNSSQNPSFCAVNLLTSVSAIATTDARNPSRFSCFASLSLTSSAIAGISVGSASTTIAISVSLFTFAA